MYGGEQLHFYFYKFISQQICIYRNELLVVDTLINATDENRLYFNKMSDLATEIYIDDGHGIKLSEYLSQLIVAFDMTTVKFYLPWIYQLFNFYWT